MKIGFALPHYDFSFPDHAPVTVDRAVSWARRAEDLGFDSVWVSDHFFLSLARYGGPDERFGSLEALTTLAAVAARTERIRLGTLVLCAAFRPAALLANSAQTLDGLSAGRLDLGIGAGWYEDEFRFAGVRFGSPRERIEEMEATIDLVRTALDDGRLPDPASVKGWEPATRARPAVWVGSKGGPRGLRAVAEHADGWNVVWRITPEGYRALVDALERACASTGRDPGTVRRSIGLTCLLGTDPADVALRYEALREWAPGGALRDTSLEEYADGALVGTPAACARRLEEFAALGVEHCVLSFANVPFAVSDEEQPEIAAHELIPMVR